MKRHLRGDRGEGIRCPSHCRRLLLEEQRLEKGLLTTEAHVIVVLEKIKSEKKIQGGLVQDKRVPLATSLLLFCTKLPSALVQSITKYGMVEK